MKLKFIILCFFTSIILIPAQEKTLFIGNSMTYFNNMPNLFQEIANSKGKNVQAEYYAPGGTGFINHHVDNNVYNLLRNNVWTNVILQPGTSESAGVSWPVNTTIQRGQRMIDSIRKYSPCAKIFLYQIPYGIKATNNVPDYNDYFNIQTKIKDSITKMAHGLRIPLIPAGESARNHFSSSQDLLLHSSYNDVHPNLNGSYLVACTAFTTIYQENVNVSNYLGGVTQGNATYFQGIADNVTLTNRSNWLINTYNLNADFVFQINGPQVTFNNQSSNYTTVEWNINNEVISGDINLTHTFTETGTKTVTLKVIKDGCQSIITKTIDIQTLSNPLFEQVSLVAYPNPAKSHLSINNNKNFTFNIINVLGQVVYTNNENKSNYIIQTDNLINGVYFILTNFDEKIKFIKN
ncbi:MULTISPECIES: T9SS type A sorting domain-containing protein [Flavobacterium]|jgi:hypothetical protein|uniref:T9SS type A sorting domain-containing protein n=2 Tax=Flavobacterium TaxID=237 RepID=A0ABU9I787_9FLAO|nr:T9SS type A sorting domain-containing protein [Flavobacterium cheniae]TDR23069.1 putative secreted protein (Por secretion system target) [Flavobacterium cheniae]TWH97071.1 putative secreted protein (Por secretion system target) [Flavobacterium cheniae]